MPPPVQKPMGSSARRSPDEGPIGATLVLHRGLEGSTVGEQKLQKFM